MTKKEIENVSASNVLMEKAAMYMLPQKYESWLKDARELDERTLEETVKIMEMLSSNISVKGANKEVEKIKDATVKSKVIKMVTNYAHNGPEFALERVRKNNGGKIDRNNEYVQGLFYKMDENIAMKHEMKHEMNSEREM